jgi:hypothetical protein
VLLLLARTLFSAAGCIRAAAGSARKRSSSTTVEDNRRIHHSIESCTTGETNSRASGKSVSSQPMERCELRYLRPSMSISTADCSSTELRGCTATPVSTAFSLRSPVKSAGCVPHVTPSVRLNSGSISTTQSLSVCRIGTAALRSPNGSGCILDTTGA